MHCQKFTKYIDIHYIYLDIDFRARMDDLNFLVEFFQDHMKIVNIIVRNYRIFIWNFVVILYICQPFYIALMNAQLF